jgi:hypothetical protein
MSDFADIFDDWTTESVVIRDVVGGSMEGTKHDAPRVLAGVYVERARRLVRGSDGREIVSETTIYVPPGKVVPTEGARVDYTDGTHSVVVKVAQHALDDVFDHAVVNVA